MGERIRRTAGEMGISTAHLDLLERVHAAAMAPRIELVEAEAPDFLHPGRTALILMQDIEERDPLTLAAAMLVDSERPELEAGASLLSAWPVAPTTPDPLGVVFSDWLDEAVSLAASVPVGRLRAGSDDDLLERLVVADERTQRIALAERLDQLRHAHLWADIPRRRAAHEQAVNVYAPLAGRVHELMSRRYERWCEMFAKRHLPPAS
jgi:hypothetical protein